MFRTIIKRLLINNSFKDSFRLINSSKTLAEKSQSSEFNVKICPPTDRKPELKPFNIDECEHKRKQKKEEPKKEEKKEAKVKEEDEEEEDLSTEPLVGAYDDSKVVIVGGGVAGIAAAKYLEENNIKNYVILEALGRIGGRIQTEWFGDTIIELGARCHKGSTEFGQFLQMAIADGFLTGPITHTIIFSTCDGRSVNQSTSLIAYEIFKKIYCESLDLESGRLDYFNFRMENELENFPPHVKQDAARVMLGLLALVNKKEGDSLQFVTKINSGTYLQSPGGSVKVPLGYYGVLQPMIDSIPPQKIKLNKPVQNIRWGAVVCKDTPRALVKCCDGSVYPADYVIVTVSLGVLKEISDSLFCPALPADKVAALNTLGYYHLNHIYYEFEEPFWSWTTEDIDLKFTEKELQKREDWTRGITRIKRVTGSNSVIWVRVAEKHAKHIERLDDSTILRKVLDIIKNETKILCIPSVVGCRRSSWSNNAHFNGAYSYLPTGASEEIQQKLSSPLPGKNAPVSPILFFAGEATCPKLHATVQGAKISGIREASRIKHIIESNADQEQRMAL